MVVAAIERVAELDRRVLALAAADDVDARRLDDVGEIRRVRAAHEREARDRALDVRREAEVVAVKAGRRAERHDVRAEPRTSARDVVAARAHEAAVVTRVLQAAGDVERAERLRALDLLDDEQHLAPHRLSTIPPDSAGEYRLEALVNPLSRAPCAGYEPLGDRSRPRPIGARARRKFQRAELRDSVAAE